MINVTKRDGAKEALDLDKIHQILFFACEGLTGVSVSEIEMRSQLQFFEGMNTQTIHDILIKAASELISEETPNYQYVAGRLINYSLRKQVYGSYEPIKFIDHVTKLVEIGKYDKEIFEKYSTQELEELGRYIKHKRDDKFTFVAMKQWEGKYLLQNRANPKKGIEGKIFETPQMAYMMISAIVFMNYTENRIQWVKKFYDAVSNFDISLPTPIMAGLRTNTRQFSSCVVLNVGDSLDSIAAGNSAIMKYISKKAGLGVNYGRVRAVGSEIRGGDAVHTGLIPFLSAVAKTVKSCSQGGVRGGAATVHFPLWHYEFEDLIVLKNNKGTENSRVRQLDYCFQFNKTLYQRLLDRKNITFFSPSDVPGLYDAFCSDQAEFERLYVQYENDPSIRRKTLTAIEAFSQFMTERSETGRIYVQNIDLTNEHSPFDEKVAPVEQSNLCQEIALPSIPFEDVKDDENGLISLCTLAAINWGNFDTPSEMEEACDLAVRALDALLDYQEYPVIHAERATKAYRPLGVGIINLAYFLAKRGLRYDDGALATINEWSEAWSYYLLKSSVQLAKEQGRCEKFENLKYAKGILPIDTYKRSIDSLVGTELKMDWDTLRADIAQYGIRNATTMALMPAETSAQISNSTNGIEPPRNLVSVKASKDGILKQVVPEIGKLKNKYTLLWEQTSNDGYIKICGVLQKYIDQSISANTSYNPENYPDKKLSMSMLLEDLMKCYKYGLKNLYYMNTNDGSGEVDLDKLEDVKKEKGIVIQLPPMEEDEEDCDSCKI
jgi:ribonucleoside-diphosphate reductase alpha chain